MKTLNILILVLSCCASALACGLFGCGENGGDGDAICEDGDGDGYGTTQSSSCVNPGLDCDDSDADVHPDAPELCDGIDNQCQGDVGHGMVDDDAVCHCSFQGGSYQFELNEVDSNCPGIDMAVLFPPGTTYGPMELPGFQDLPTTAIEVPFGPLMGEISVRFFSGGDDIRFEGTEAIQVNLPERETVTASFTGAFCPNKAGGVLAGFTIAITSPIPCVVSMEANGTPSAF